MFVTPYKFPIIEGALKIGIQLPLFFLEISMEQTKICFHQINQIFQKTYVRHSPNGGGILVTGPKELGVQGSGGARAPRFW